jgi:hypothetical protein
LAHLCICGNCFSPPVCIKTFLQCISQTLWK